MRPKGSAVVKTGHGFIHLGGLFVLSRRLQLWFLEFRGLLFEINVRAFLTSLRRDNGLLKDLMMATNWGQLRESCSGGYGFNCKRPLGQLSSPAFRPSRSFALSSPPPFHVRSLQFSPWVTEGGAMKGGQCRSFWQGRANSASSAVEKGERERGRKRKREKKGKADSARQSRVREDRQCETTQTPPREQSDAIVLSQNGLSRLCLYQHLHVSYIHTCAFRK